MWFSSDILLGQADLKKVWLAGTIFKRLKKREIKGTNIEGVCNDVHENEKELAISTCGVLTLGIARIHDKSVFYLLSDANDARSRLRGAKRRIDLDQTADDAKREQAITLGRGQVEVDAFDLEQLELGISESDLRLDLAQLDALGESVSLSMDSFETGPLPLLDFDKLKTGDESLALDLSLGSQQPEAGGAMDALLGLSDDLPLDFDLIGRGSSVSSARFRFDLDQMHSIRSSVDLQLPFPSSAAKSKERAKAEATPLPMPTPEAEFPMPSPAPSEAPPMAAEMVEGASEIGDGTKAVQRSAAELARDQLAEESSEQTPTPEPSARPRRRRGAVAGARPPRRRRRRFHRDRVIEHTDDAHLVADENEWKQHLHLERPRLVPLSERRLEAGDFDRLWRAPLSDRFAGNERDELERNYRELLGEESVEDMEAMGAAMAVESPARGRGLLEAADEREASVPPPVDDLQPPAAEDLDFDLLPPSVEPSAVELGRAVSSQPSDTRSAEFTFLGKAFPSATKPLGLAERSSSGTLDLDDLPEMMEPPTKRRKTAKKPRRGLGMTSTESSEWPEADSGPIQIEPVTTSSSDQLTVGTGLTFLSEIFRDLIKEKMIEETQDQVEFDALVAENAEKNRAVLTRKDASIAFMQTLVLKNCAVIDVKQEGAFEPIMISKGENFDLRFGSV